jgi:dipeptidyl aminopeptidase/acylaminoacyl peptidase
VIFLHGHQEGARPGGEVFVRWGVLDRFAGRGDLAVAVSRSVLNYASDIKASTLILNGEKDERTDAGQARHLAEEITLHGGNARAVIYPDKGHQIPIEVRDKDIDSFIDRVLRDGEDRHRS